MIKFNRNNCILATIIFVVVTAIFGGVMIRDFINYTPHKISYSASEICKAYKVWTSLEGVTKVENMELYCKE